MYYFLLIKDFKQVFKNEELRAYLGVILFSIVCITINILSMYNFDVLKSIPVLRVFKWAPSLQQQDIQVVIIVYGHNLVR